MSDLIDRHAAIAYAISGRVRTLTTSEDGEENWIRTEEVRQSLLTMPSAEPVKHAHWIIDFPLGINGEHNFVCSSCGIHSWLNTEYCPHCGAKMEKGWKVK